jgi:hypothetical protein
MHPLLPYPTIHSDNKMHPYSSVMAQVPRSLRVSGPRIRQAMAPRSGRHRARAPRLALATFLEACPWTVAQGLDDDFWPEEEASR